MVFFRRKLRNGATLVGDYIGRKDVSIITGDVVSISIGLPVGSIHDPQGLEGNAHFLEHILFKPQGRSSLRRELIEAAENRGAEINAGTDYLSTIIECETLPEHLDKSVALLVNLLGRPDPSPIDFKTERETVLKNYIRAGRDYPKELWTSQDLHFIHLLWAGP